MTGSFREAGDQVAELPEVEGDTFLHFCQYAYTGNYILPVAVANMNPEPTSLRDLICLGLEAYHCRNCKVTTSSRGWNWTDFPFCSSNCKDKLSPASFWHLEHYCASCCAQFSDVGGRYESIMASLCDTCTRGQPDHDLRPHNSKSQHSTSDPLLVSLSHSLSCLHHEKKHHKLTVSRQIQGLPSRQSSALEDATSLRRRYVPVGGLPGQEVRNYLSAAFPHDLPSKRLRVHAQLYQFADMYMIEHLKQLVLHKFHRDLI